ncbi:MAG: ROK family protein [Candidatus Saccharibacteria bacterium]|nr:ROK family protein [Candidatus Saccharibacteria bacterium]
MIVAVDTGGTKTLVATFTKDGTLQASHTFPTPKDISLYLTTLTTAISQLHPGIPRAIAVALPGIIEGTTAIWCKNLQWQNIAIAELLQPHYPQTPIFVENDANLAGLAEARMQKIDTPCTLYITVSTGIGTGFVHHTAISRTLQQSEGGQMLLPYQNKLQQWEEFASGKAIFAHYQKFGNELHDPAAWEDIADRISRGLLALIPLTQPRVIIFGGSMGAYFTRYQQPLEQILADTLPPHIIRPTLVQALHPTHAVAYGGYFYAIDQLAR